MSRITRWAFLVLAMPLAVGQAAQDEKKIEDKKPAAAPAADKPLEVIAHYHDGTKVRMVFLQQVMEIDTKYGKLKVPTADVRRIDFGFRLSPEIQQKLDESLANLTKDNFQLRENAAKDLVALGRLSYPALLKLSKGQDLDTTRRIEDMLKAIRTKIPAEQLKSRTEDLVHTHTFTIAGKIEGTTVKAKTEHFGEVALKLVDLRNLQSSSTVGEVKVSVDAMTYGGNNVQWMDTGFTVQPDVQLTVTASGEVDLYGVQSPGSGALSGHVDLLLEMQYYSTTDPADRRRKLLARSRFTQTERQLVIELNEAGTDWHNLGSLEQTEFGNGWDQLGAILLDAAQKLTRPEILEAWPADPHPPSLPTLYRWLERAVSLALVHRDGTGKRNDPHRYWLPGQEEKWAAENTPESLARKANEEMRRFLDGLR